MPSAVRHLSRVNANKFLSSLRSPPPRLKAPRVPDGNLFILVFPDAFAIVIVAYAISISISKTMALKHGYKVDSNQVRLGQT